jgi:hypothetical protein
MTRYTTDVSQQPTRAGSGSGRVDIRRLGPIALAMSVRTARRGPYVEPTERDYFAY